MHNDWNGVQLKFTEGYGVLIGSLEIDRFPELRSRFDATRMGFACMCLCKSDVINEENCVPRNCF